MTTWQDLIRLSLVEIGVIADTEQPTDQQTADSIARINGLLGIWASEDYLVPAPKVVRYAITSSNTHTASITIESLGLPVPGQTPPANNINAIPPVIIESLMYQGNEWSFALPLTPVNRLLWLVTPPPLPLPDTMPSRLVTRFYYHRDYPKAMLYLDELMPAGSQISISGRTYFDTVTNDNKNNEINLPPGFDEAIMLNLALNLAPSYGMQANPVTATRAEDAIQALVRKNTEEVDEMDVGRDEHDTPTDEGYEQRGRRQQ